jgi:hypothetical protein
MTTYIILAVSGLFNIFLIWYIRELLLRFSYVEENSVFFYNAIVEYQDHLETVYNLPMYYGEETLKNLMDHTIEIKENSENLKIIFDLREEEILEGEDLEQEDG